MLGRLNKSEFWNWFKEQKSEFEEFLDSKESNYAIYEELVEKVREYNLLISPELRKEEDKYIILFTPNGSREGINATIEIYDNQPKLENWKVEKFRQSKDNVALNIGDIKYESKDILVRPIKTEENKYDLSIYISKKSEDEMAEQNQGMFYLEQILGEYNLMTKIRHICLYDKRTDENILGGISILDFRRMIEDSY